MHPCLTLADIRRARAQRFQINDAVQCPSPADLANPRLLRTRKCLDGNAAALVTKEGWMALLLFFIGFVCYRVRASVMRAALLRFLAAAASAEKRALSQVFFYWCHRTKERMRATSAVVHPMDAVAPACAAAEEGVASTAQLTSVQPLSRGRPRGRAAANSMDVISATAAATPLEPHGTVTAM